MATLCRFSLCLSLFWLVACGVEPSVGSVPESWVEQTSPVPNDDEEDPGSVPNGSDETGGDTEAETDSTPGDDSSNEEDPAEETPDTGMTPCDIAWGLFSQCEPPPEGCESSAVGECILAVGPAVVGYCEALDEGQCQGSQLSEAAYEYCQIQSCLGYNYDTCLTDQLMTCESETCEGLDSAVGHCPGYD